MKFLIFSDCHVDWITAGVDREEDLFMALDEVMKESLLEQVDMVIFSGDWCDPDTSRVPRCIAKSIEMGMFFYNEGIPSRWVTGNHDVIEDGRRTHVLLPLRELGFALPKPEAGPEHFHAQWLKVVDQPWQETVYARDLKSSVTITYLPFTARAAAYDPSEFIEDRTFTSTSPNLVVGHLHVAGIIPGSETHDMPRGREIIFPVAECLARFGKDVVMVNGHYHRQQKFNGIWIPGSLERLTFGEEPHPSKGWIIMEIDGGEDKSEEKKAVHKRPSRSKSKRATAADA